MCLTLTEDEETIYLVGHIDQLTPSLTFRAELFLNPELSLQYYGSPYFSVGEFSDFKRVDQSRERDMEARLEALDVIYDEGNTTLAPHSTWCGHTIVPIGRGPTIPYQILWEIFLQVGETMFLCSN